MLFVLFYIFIGLLIPFSLKFGEVKYDDNGLRWKFPLPIAFAVTVIVRGLVYDTGTDYLFYFSHYEHEAQGLYSAWGAHTEFGYKYLIKMLSQLVAYPELFFLVSAVIVMFSNIKLASNFGMAAPYILYIWPIFMFTMSMNLYRQYIAMSFLLLALYYVYKQKWLFYFLFSLLAVSFHTSSLLIVVLILVIYINKNIHINKYIVVGIILFVNFVSEKVNSILYTSIDLFQIIFSYANGNAYSAENISGSMYESSIIQYIYMLIFIIWIWFAEGISRIDAHFRVLYYISLLGFVTFPIFQQEILSRINLYFIAFVPFFMGVLFLHYKRNNIKVLFLLLLTLIFPIARYLYYLYSLGQVHPFQINLLKNL